MNNLWRSTRTKIDQINFIINILCLSKMFRYLILYVRLFFCLSLYSCRKKNEWMNCAKLVQSQTEMKYTQPAHKKYTTITTSRRNKNNNKVSMCECTNENNKQKIIACFFFFKHDKNKKQKRIYIWFFYSCSSSSSSSSSSSPLSLAPDAAAAALRVLDLPADALESPSSSSPFSPASSS